MTPVLDTEEVLERIAAGSRVRRTLPDGGLLHMDRPLPFLCVHRAPSAGPDEGLRRMVQAEPSFLIVPSGTAWKRWGRALVGAITGALAERFGGVLILEIWSNGDWDGMEKVHPQSGEPLPPRPRFRVSAQQRFARSETVECLLSTLEKIRALKQSASVSFAIQDPPRPSGAAPLLSKDVLADERVYVLGLAVAPVYRSAETDAVFPPVVRVLRRALARALNRTFYVFSRARTTIQPHHHYTLGRRTVGRSVWEADRILADVESRFDPLLLATPTNAETAWLQFKRSRFDRVPTFHYRPAQVDTAVLKRRLFSAPVERIDDPTLAYLFRQKQDELDRQITSLNDIGTPKFLSGSLQIYGNVPDSLQEVARTLLERIPPRERKRSKQPLFGAARIAERAREEIEHYKAIDPGFEVSVEVREDLFSGMMVSRGRLLIGSDIRVTEKRLEALVQHEVGTHLITYHNGRSQPLQQLALGLAGYDGLQEGLAVLAEYFVDGMSQFRLRLLAARAVAVRAMLDGATFIETFRLINRYYGFRQQTAYLIAMRVFRGGGLTKDAIYLGGLVQILDYLHDGGDMDLLWTGKIAAEHVPFIEELRMRKVLHSPALAPRFRLHSTYLSKLERLTLGLTVFDLSSTPAAS